MTEFHPKMGLKGSVSEFRVLNRVTNCCISMASAAEMENERVFREADGDGTPRDNHPERSQSPVTSFGKS